ncbi:MAG: hypothetical protein J0M00_27340, partial [Burkholderiales bacterium]|nr:hypothetical protein [Burkholderiales bacterium]
MPKPSLTESDASTAASLRELDALAWAGRHAQAEALAGEALLRDGLTAAQRLALLDRRAASLMARAQAP